MIGTTMIVAGVMLMAPTRRRFFAVAETGDVLREAYRGAIIQPVPTDMRRTTARIGGPLRVVKGGRAR